MIKLNISVIYRLIPLRLGENLWEDIQMCILYHNKTEICFESDAIVHNKHTKGRIYIGSNGKASQKMPILALSFLALTTNSRWILWLHFKRWEAEMFRVFDPHIKAKTVLQINKIHYRSYAIARNSARMRKYTF